MGICTCPDDRPNRSARLHLFKKGALVYGNAFGMTPGLETDEWAAAVTATELMEVLGNP